MTDMDLLLIKFVEKHPFLYDSKHEKSKDKLLLEKTWKTISSQLGLPAKDCAERWLSLRSRFSKERGKIIRSGKNTDWPLMEHLVFLHGHVRKRRSFGIPLGNTDSRISTTNITSEEDENTFLESEIENVDMDQIGSGYSMDLKRPKFLPNAEDDSIDNQLHEFVKIVSKQPEESHESSNDDQYLRNFCDSLVSDLKCISDRKNLLKCKIEIMQIIDKYSNEVNTS